MSLLRTSPAAFLFVLVVSAALSASGEEPAARLPPGFKLEEPGADPTPTKIVLIAGSNFFKAGQHEYIGGCAVLMDLLRQSPGVFPVLAIDWPKKPETFAGAKAVVFFFDGGDKHAWLDESRRAQVKQMAEAGVGFVSLHQDVDISRELGPLMREWMGASFEKGYSQRAHWIAEFTTFPDHPICRGVTPFRIDDGWLYKLRFVEGLQGITPLLRTVSPKAKAAAADSTSEKAADSSSIVSWAYERPGSGRSFVFTGGHLHASLAEAGYRRFLVNGILWTGKVDIPPSGAPVRLDPGSLDRYLTAVPAPVVQ